MSWQAGLTGVATAFQAYGVYRQGQAAARQARLQSQGVEHGLDAYLQQLNFSLMQSQAQHAAVITAANFNAKTAMEDAVLAREQARAEAKQLTRESLLRHGSLRAAAGASGVASSGSVIDVIGDIVTQGELDVQNALYLGELQARGHQIDGHLEYLRARAAYSAASLEPSYAAAQARAAIAGAETEYRGYLEQARDAKFGTRLGVATTVLGGANQAYTQYQRLNA